MGLFGNNQQQNTGTLNLGVGQTNQAVAQTQNPFAPQNGMMQQAAQNPFMAGMMGGAGMQPIMLALMKSLAPADRFITSTQMQTLLQLLNDLVSFSVLEIFKSAKFTIDDDTNTIQMDVTSLPQNLQTMSGENVSNQFNALKMSSQQNIQNAEMQ